MKIFDGSNEETYYVDDGIVEFKNNCLSILTSNIFDMHIYKLAVHKKANIKHAIYKIAYSN